MAKLFLKIIYTAIVVEMGSLIIQYISFCCSVSFNAPSNISLLSPTYTLLEQALFTKLKIQWGILLGHLSLQSKWYELYGENDVPMGVVQPEIGTCCWQFCDY